jgi:non-canonical purine NTP pyrophosphatase (RdgB/HAM1 family)
MNHHITFITGNPNKAAYVSRQLGYPVAHQKIDFAEIQSLELKEIVKVKAERAYKELGDVVLVEDVSVVFNALGRLPGPFIKFFVEEISDDDICKLLAGFEDRSATARICYCLYDGEEYHYFEGSMTGIVPLKPRGDNGFGWDRVFVQDGMDQTRAELDTEIEAKTSMRAAPLSGLSSYLHEHYPIG